MRGEWLALGAVGALALAGARRGALNEPRVPYVQKTHDHRAEGSTFSTPVLAFEDIAIPFLDESYCWFFGLNDGCEEEVGPKVAAAWRRRGVRSDDKVFSLHTLYVQPGVRGRGLGRATVERLEAKLTREGVRAILLQAGQPDPDLLENSVSFWKRMGYKVWPGAYPSWSEDRIMFKVLERGSRSIEPFYLDKFASVAGRFEPSQMDDLEEDLGTFCAVLPGARKVLPKASLDLRPPRLDLVPQGWYLPDSRTIRLQGYTTMICHEAVHHLDRSAGKPTEQICWPASHGASGTLGSFREELKASPHYLALEQALMAHVPTKLRSKVKQEAIFLPDALRLLSEEMGQDLNVEQVARQIIEARSPFGGILARGYRSVPAPLLPAVRALAGTLPVGVPMSFLVNGSTDAERKRYMESVSGSESVQNFRRYYLSYHELLARLVDQFVRRRAAELGRRPPGSTTYDVPEDLFLRFEADVERQLSKAGWR